MNIEISVSSSQLAGRLPVYIKGKRYWLLTEEDHRKLLEVKKLQKQNLKLIQELRERVRR
jgi:hypothetical protein